RLAEADRDRLLLVVDQFEELLTQPPDLRHRAAGQLVALIGSGAPVSVLLVMRDDFYPQLAAMLPQLLAAATPGLVNIPAALRVPELLEIIGGPARAAGIGIETGLVERIVDDLCSADPDRRAPVTLLPPLELALRQLWQRREDGRLTHDAYQRIGAVTGALTTWCNTALAQLPARHRTVARRMLTALVRPADDAHAIPATRRQLSISTLRALAAGPADTAVDEVLAALTRYRIITTGSTPRPGRPPEPTAELIHDALLRDWPDLRRWVADDHRFQVWLHRAAEQRQRHRLSGQPGDLLAGTALSEGIDWAGERSLPADIAEFLTASHQSWQATARRTRRLNRLLAGLLVVSLVATGLALWQSQLAGTAQREAQARQLAAQSAALRETSPDLSALLAVQAHRTDDSTAEGSPALQAFADSPLRKRLDLHGGNAKALAYSTDGRLLAAAGEQGGTSLWETGSGRERHILRGHAGEVNAVAFSPGNSVLATAGQDRTARIWDVGSGRQRALLRGHESTVNNVEFSGDGTVVVTSSGDGTARIWDSRTGRQLRSFTVHGRGALEIAFSGDGRTLVTANNDGTAQLWDVETGRQRALVGDTGVEVFSVALSPDVRMLAAAGVDHRIRLWDLETGQERAALTGHFTYVFSMEFSPDGKTLASASLDTSARLWDVGTGEELHILTGGNASSMLRTAFSPDGRTLVTTDDDRVARLWDVESGRQRRALTGHNGAVAWAAFSPDGAPLATAAVDGTARLWEARAGEPRLMLAE
ncbi:WD40 repeat domain-containing protein, partial [Saccharopolyspora kobensis]